MGRKRTVEEYKFLRLDKRTHEAISVLAKRLDLNLRQVVTRAVRHYAESLGEDGRGALEVFCERTTKGDGQ